MGLLSKITLGIAGLIGCQTTKSQTFNPQSYQQEQASLQQKGMYVLAGWAGLNIISGAYFSGHTEGSSKYFHRMNLYWNTVNGLLSIVALYRLQGGDKAPATFASLYKTQQSLEKTFLLNAGLDVAYMTAGALLVEKGKNSLTNRDKYKGFGNSVLVQGGFLLLFDGVMYSLLHHKGKTLDKVLEKVQLTPMANGVSLAIDL